MPGPATSINKLDKIVMILLGLIVVPILIAFAFATLQASGAVGIIFALVYIGLAITGIIASNKRLAEVKASKTEAIATTSTTVKRLAPDNRVRIEETHAHKPDKFVVPVKSPNQVPHPVYATQTVKPDPLSEVCKRIFGIERPTASQLHDKSFLHYFEDVISTRLTELAEQIEDIRGEITELDEMYGQLPVMPDDSLEARSRYQQIDGRTRALINAQANLLEAMDIASKFGIRTKQWEPYLHLVSAKT